MAPHRHIALALAGWIAATASCQAAAADIAVVVGAGSPIDEVSVDTLRDVYLRRQRLWPDGASALPVNLPADDPLRQVFSRRVLGRSPDELVGYWNRRWFEGVRPPLVLRSARAVCAYLATEPGGVGYVPADEVDAETCRVVRLIER